ncbi:prolyl endopeptidase [Streptomyces sp. L-9-10]|uniref:prolyl oligopeptidase family serine peptidase n=1 Tax=Streptomyces sp. L-9-10 TaxID=1478131 RepID=UPI0010CE2E66|nr:prolyl oligopeptidase family serine peptidase [Streptomyces sp. L-9-10]RYJ20077.1 prolyl endopeptidase [Streptomyces sp. L-9-10]
MLDGIPVPPAPDLTGDGTDTDTGTPTDPYRWLEETDSPRTLAWLHHQRRLLEQRPGRAEETAWEELVTDIERGAAGRLLTPPAEAGGTLFTHQLHRSGGESLSARRPDGSRHVLLDPQSDPSAGRVAAWRPDPRGRVVAVQLHHDGRENGGAHLLSADGTRPPEYLPDASPHPALAFHGDLLLYSGGTRTEHTLRTRRLLDGTTGSVALPVTGPVRLSLHHGHGGHLLLRTRNPDGSSPLWWCTRWDGRSAPDWQPLPFDDLPVTAFALGPDSCYVAAGGLYVLDLGAVARGTATRPVPLGDGPEDANTPGADATTSVRALRVLGPEAAPRLAVLRQTGTVRHLEFRPARGTAADGTGLHEQDGRRSAAAPDRTAGGFTWHARLRLGSACHGPDGELADALWFLADDPRYGTRGHRIPNGPPLSSSPPASPSPSATRTSALRALTAVSRDGTPVSVTVCDPAQAVGGRPVPTLITVYGGFGIPLEPSWDPIFAAWLASGGRVAWVHARGGGEFGRAWAAAGRGAGKNRTVDDLCAAAEAVLDAGEAAPGQLAALAASNGGLVVAAATIRSPHLFSAVVCAAPLTDMARYHLGGLGALWLEEYGDPADPEALRALLSYSPYHRVTTGDAYPATLLVTGGNDERVPPWHAWKLCAALQDAGPGRAPVLLDHEENTGHRGREATAARALSARVLALLSLRTGLTPRSRA